MTSCAIIYFSRSVSSELRHKPFCRDRWLACTVHRRIALRVHAALAGIPADTFWFSDVPLRASLWRSLGFKENIVQEGSTLRERLLNAFERICGRGYMQVLVIGGDTLLSADDIRQAVRLPGDAIGPSWDGGFYLLKPVAGSAALGLLAEAYWNEGRPEIFPFDLAVLTSRPDFDSVEDVVSFFPDLSFAARVHRTLAPATPGLSVSLGLKPTPLSACILNRPPPAGL
jgi:hypothetical protein